MNSNKSFLSTYRVLILFVVLMIAGAILIIIKPSAGETYTASATGFGGELKLEVVIGDGVIKSVNILENSETEGIGSVAIDEMPAQIVAANGIDVDGVSSASYTTRAIKEAVADCMKQAGMEVD